MTHEVLNELEYPITYITEIPTMFRFYLQRDAQYRNSSLLAIAAINSIYILAVNHSKLDAEVFWKKIYHRKQ